VRFLRSKRGLAASAAVVMLALFLVRPGAEQLRTRIVRVIGLALGRPVEVSSVSIRLLPRPGFDLQNFVVHEDAAFGAEPTLRAGEVTATLRLISLLRGRLEIARLSLTDPSINLVRNAAGRWNLENLLERADQTHVAPTGKSKSEARPGFPYIEASSARINFKFGPEKMPYTLTDADFTVWQDSENAWGMRMLAQPVRTDFNLSDTGTVRIQGSWQRAASLRDTPLQFVVQWDRSQLGQATTLFYGSDQGWRGAVAVSATLSGTPGDLAIQSRVAVDDFRRYDLNGGGALRLAAECSAHFAPLERKLSALSCRAPVGGGFVTLEGEVNGYNNPRAYHLTFKAANVPMQSLISFARHTKRNIPDDLTATGTLEAQFGFVRMDGLRSSRIAPSVTWDGEGKTRNFGMSSPLNGTSLFLDRVPFSVSPGTPPDSRSLSRHPPPIWAAILAVPHLEVGPFKLSLGRPAPVLVTGWSSRSEYALSIAGDAGIQRLLRLARSVGLPAAQPNADGFAAVDLQVTGSWSAFTPATLLGHAQLRSVRAEVRGLNQPLEIAFANVALLPSGVEVKDLSASLAAGAWHGSLAFPRQCSMPAQCLVRFNLHADTISTDDWSELLNAHTRTGPWYSLFTPKQQAGNSYLLALHAGGQITASRVAIHKLRASEVSAKVDLENGILRLSDLQGDVWGGRQVGEWRADFTAKPPKYSGSGSLQEINLEQLSQAMHDGWITGNGTASYSATAVGLTATELTASANATLQVEELEGTLPHIVLDSETGPLHVRGFTGGILLQNGEFEIGDCKLDTSGGAFQVSGTASLRGILNIKLARAHASGGFAIVGPLNAPSVAETTAAEARAALKP
jgi:AsmA family/AsmA-like C-terminal region